MVREPGGVMPFVKCPNCGQGFHLCGQANLDEWYAKFAPGMTKGEEPVTLLCVSCWSKARRGELNIEELAVSPEVMAGLRRSISDETEEDR
jgi:hypothetical protein